MKKGIICVILAVFLLTGCKGKINYIEQGTQQIDKKQYEDAVSSFKNSIEEKEDIAEAYRGLGMAYYEQKNYKAALDAFHKVLENKGEAMPSLYNLMGVCSMQLKDYKGALKAFDEGIGLSGEVTEKKDKDTDAADYTKAVKEMKFNEIVCYEKLGDWKNAKAKAEAYIVEYPDDEAAQKEAIFLKTR